MPEHDNSYKLLFSHREMVADLLRGFVKEPWVRELDLETLEPVNTSFISEDLRGREDDVIWRVRWRQQWMYVYLLLEFQATVDPFMALRVLVYVGLLYQDLVRKGQVKADDLLPPVLPVVLYNGGRPWSAAEDVADLVVQAPGGLDRYRPHLAYLLLEERCYSEEELAPLHNVVAALFRLENSGSPEEIRRVVDALVDWLKAPEQTSLRRSFVVWLRRVLLPSRVPGVAVPPVTDLQEVKAMLAERVQEWAREWREEGLRQGLQQGMQQGMQQGHKQGEEAMLVYLLERRFGPLTEDARARIAVADSGTLRLWAERVLSAGALDDVFA